MTSKLNNLDKVNDLVSKGAMFVINHSGGKDSQAMYALVSKVVPADQIIVVHADLGNVEWMGVKAHIKANITQELYIADAVYEDGSSKDLLGMVLKRWTYLLDKHASLSKRKQSGEQLTDAELKFVSKPVPAPWPSSGSRYCTSDLKRDPIAKVIKAVAKKRVATLIVNCLGLRAQESDDRAAKSSWENNKRLSNKSRTVFDWLPIHGMTTVEVFQTIADAGQQPRPMYAQGMSRLSCCFCIMANKDDLTIAAKMADPVLYAKYVAIERVTGFTMQKRSLEQITGITARADLVAIEMQLIQKKYTKAA